MALQPVGPLPASTYWRRRVVLVLVAVAAVALLVRSCGGSEGERDVLTGPTPTPDTTLSPTAPGASPTTSSAPASPRPPAACGDAALRVVAEADAAAYPKGAAPRFTLTVTNAGRVPCRRGLGPDEVELRVFSGEDRIWSSDDCGKGTGKGVVTLAAGEARALTVRWPGKRTRPGCVIGGAAQPGTYRVTARVGDIVRQGSVFRIAE